MIKSNEESSISNNSENDEIIIENNKKKHTVVQLSHISRHLLERCSQNFRSYSYSSLNTVVDLARNFLRWQVRH